MRPTTKHAALRALVALQTAALTRQAARSLPAFVEQAWPVLEPATPFLPNWHLDLICAHLEAVSAGEITRLVINVPPRYGKSLLVSVLWPAWEWIREPSRRWICTSYAETLATKHARDRRTLVQSPWFHARWGHRVRLCRHQQTKTDLENDQRGVFFATSVGGSTTGRGGTRLIVDDPHHPLQAESDTQRQQAIEYFLGTLSTRLDDPQRGAIVVIMQRLHCRDLTAVCLDQGYTHLCLPAICETPIRHVFPGSTRVVDRAVGDVLWPARESAAQLAVQQTTLGSYRFAGQYQQRPAPRGGGMFQRAWWRFYDELPAVDEWLQSWDLAFKGAAGSDWVVGLVAARRGADVYLVDRIKAHLSFTETCTALEAACRRYPRTGAVLIEDKANGPAVLDALRHRVSGLIAVEPRGGKLSRASAAQPLVEAGHVHLPRPTTPGGHPIAARGWVDDFVEALAVFPYGEHDDDVDAFSQLAARCQGRYDGFFEYLRDEYERAHGAAVAPGPPPPPSPSGVRQRVIVEDDD